MCSGEREGKGGEDDDCHQEMYLPTHHRLYCETTASDFAAATSIDVPAYPTPGDVTSYRTCFARRPEVGGTEHAHEPGTVLTLRCVEQIDESDRCGCCHVVDAEPVDGCSNAAEADRVNGAQLDLLRHDMAAASASIV